MTLLAQAAPAPPADGAPGDGRHRRDHRLPMFSGIGLVLLMPVIVLVSRRSGLPLIAVGVPALAGLPAVRGFVPPHAGPLVAVDALGADLGITPGLGILVPIPSIVLAGPVFARRADRWVGP